jgi:hypothetical protein
VKTDVSRRDQQSRAWLAYMTATLGRVKKMPKFKDVMPKAKKSGTPPGPVPWEKQLAVAQQWAAAFSRSSN